MRKIIHCESTLLKYKHFREKYESLRLELNNLNLELDHFKQKHDSQLQQFNCRKVITGVIEICCPFAHG